MDKENLVEVYDEIKRQKFTTQVQFIVNSSHEVRQNTPTPRAKKRYISSRDHGLFVRGFRHR